MSRPEVVLEGCRSRGMSFLSGDATPAVAFCGRIRVLFFPQKLKRLSVIGRGVARKSVNDCPGRPGSTPTALVQSRFATTGCATVPCRASDSICVRRKGWVGRHLHNGGQLSALPVRLAHIGPHVFPTKVTRIREGTDLSPRPNRGDRGCGRGLAANGAVDTRCSDRGCRHPSHCSSEGGSAWV